MLRKGYIDRQIEDLATGLAKVLRLKSVGDTTGALAEIRLAGKKLVGLDMETLITLPEPTLLSLFTAGGGAFDAGKCLAAATLLGERAEIEAAEGRSDAARAGFQKALVLLVEAVRREESLRTEERRAQIEALRARLSSIPV